MTLYDDWVIKRPDGFFSPFLGRGQTAEDEDTTF